MKGQMFCMVVILIIPVSMMFLSLLYFKKSKGKITERSGFRTGLSKKTEKDWKIAHQYSAKLLLIIGTLLVLGSIILNKIVIFTDGIVFLLVLIELLFYIGITIATQYKLKHQ